MVFFHPLTRWIIFHPRALTKLAASFSPRLGLATPGTPSDQEGPIATFLPTLHPFTAFYVSKTRGRPKVHGNPLEIISFDLVISTLDSFILEVPRRPKIASRHPSIRLGIPEKQDGEWKPAESLACSRRSRCVAGRRGRG